MARPDLELHDLTRTFGRGTSQVTAVDRISLEVPAGQLIALLGENGAGKTTLTKILATLLLPTSGTAQVCGHNVATEESAVRAATTAVFGGDRGLYPMLSGRENLRYFGAVARVRRRELSKAMPQVLDQLGLAEAADRKVETYSKGMRQRLHLAVALLTRPQVLLLDEPTVGLDPLEAERLRTTVENFRADGTTVLLTSHNLLDVERLAERVAMIARGRLVHDLSLAEFRGLGGAVARVVARIAGDVLPDEAVLRHRASVCPDLDADGVQLHAAEGSPTVHLPVRAWSGDTLTAIATVLDGHLIEDLKVQHVGLEDAFATAARESA